VLLDMFLQPHQDFIQRGDAQRRVFLHDENRRDDVSIFVQKKDDSHVPEACRCCGFRNARRGFAFDLVARRIGADEV